MHLALANRRAELERLVQERTEQLESTRTELIKRLARVLEVHESQAVGNRVMRLGHYAKLIAQASGAKPEVAEMMQKAAPLHDIGKLGVPAEILRKTREALGAGLGARQAPSRSSAPRSSASTTTRCSSSRASSRSRTTRTTTARGYPKGLKGEAIPWGGRVMAIVDSLRGDDQHPVLPRRRCRSERAPARSSAARASSYDPKLVEAFKKALPVMQKVRETYCRPARRHDQPRLRAQGAGQARGCAAARCRRSPR